ncbi:MAG: transposase family protein [Planctomycetota bacterium]|jgi:hypothetical protein
MTDRLIERDVACSRCGYNLRGRSRREGACPECGASMRDALRPAGAERGAGLFRASGRVVAAVVVVFIFVIAFVPETWLPRGETAHHLVYGVGAVAMSLFLLVWNTRRRDVGRFSGPVGHVVKVVMSVLIGVPLGLLGISVLWSVIVG